MLKVRELMAPSAGPEPDEDQSEAFLAAAQRGNSTKVRRVSHRRCLSSLLQRMASVHLAGTPHHTLTAPASMLETVHVPAVREGCTRGDE
jgi:hypothetical protein